MPQSFPAFFRRTALPVHQRVKQPRSSWNLSLGGFYGDFIVRTWLIKLVAISDRGPSLAPLQTLQIGGWGWKLPPSDHLVFLVTSLILKRSRGPNLTHLIHINSNMVKRGSLWITKIHPYYSGNFKGFRSSVLGTRTKTKFIFVIPYLPPPKHGSNHLIFNRNQKFKFLCEVS